MEDELRLAEKSCERMAAQIKTLTAERDEMKKALSLIALIENQYNGGDWDEIEAARRIAIEALKGLA